jgi:hypothetical protein
MAVLHRNIERQLAQPVSERGPPSRRRNATALNASPKKANIA